jgi:hypothetical protein
MAERAGAKTIKVKSSHAVMSSHPCKFAALIEAADGAYK